MKHFEIEVINIFLMKCFDICDTEKVLIIKNWLWRGLQIYIETYISRAKVIPNCLPYFLVLYDRFKCNKTVLSLQYCKLSRNSDETAEEWMDRYK